ncbi:MAG: phosphoribosylaminoimidazolesuccinocarboxamide synthase [Lentisphaerae bacterium]|nr:phosphoribosylaminoimidazolesuccinocarboxamide synthase [Lentisphaerota bacterium]
MSTLRSICTPQLTTIHRGKVRDSLRVDDATRLLVVSDRLSAFDRVLDTPIPMKGEVLSRLSNWWFGQTADIVPNHVLRVVDPIATLVKEVEPIRIEMIVRGYLTGSMGRAYDAGVRTFCGVDVPDGLKPNQRFPQPLVTPTTKEKNDREIRPEEIVSEGWTTVERYGQMKDVALRLFERGSRVLAEKGLILVDTKYEFGLLDGELVLIDESHTPDSSRMWDQAAYEQDPLKVEAHDKEYVRAWLRANRRGGEYPVALPDDVVRETTRRYVDIYERVTGEKLEVSAEDPRARLARHLHAAGLIRDGFVVFVMGSRADLDHANTMKAVVESYGIYADVRVCSAHKNGEDLPALLAEYDSALEPGAIVAIAGLSNGLGGSLAANSCLPVISCPPFKDGVDMLLNLNSSLMMPSAVPNMTVIKPREAAAAALRALNLPRLKDRFREEIVEMKERLRYDDREVREAAHA